MKPKKKYKTDKYRNVQLADLPIVVKLQNSKDSTKSEHSEVAITLPRLKIISHSESANEKEFMKEAFSKLYLLLRLD